MITTRVVAGSSSTVGVFSRMADSYGSSGGLHIFRMRFDRFSSSACEKIGGSDFTICLRELQLFLHSAIPIGSVTHSRTMPEHVIKLFANVRCCSHFARFNERSSCGPLPPL